MKERYKNGDIKAVLPELKFGEEHHGWIEIDKETLMNLILLGYTIPTISKYFNCSKPTLISRIKKYFSKTYTEIRKEYGITDRKTNIE